MLRLVGLGAEDFREILAFLPDSRAELLRFLGKSNFPSLLAALVGVLSESSTPVTSLTGVVRDNPVTDDAPAAACPASDRRGSAATRPIFLESVPAATPPEGLSSLWLNVPPRSRCEDGRILHESHLCVECSRHFDYS